MKRTLTFNVIFLCLLLFVAKTIGAVFRLPLTWIIGAEGIGIYQLVFPVYVLFLTLTSSFVPQAISKLVSSFVAQQDFKSAKKCAFIGGLVVVIGSLFGAFILAVCAPHISALQGNASIVKCYYMIAPAVVFVGCMSVIKGYFQGLEIVIYTGVTNLIEQIIKVVFGLLLASKWVQYGVIFGVMGALLGVTISEFVSLIYLIIISLIKRKKHSVKTNTKANIKSSECLKLFLKICFPVAICGLIMPMVQFIDSSLIINLLPDGIDLSNKSAVFGLSGGVVGSLINLPVVFSLAVATVALPKISGLCERKNMKEIKNVCTKALTIVLLLTIPCMVGMMILSPNIIDFLYAGSIESDYLLIATRLLCIGSVSIVLLALSQVTSSILQGMGKFYLPLVSLLIGGALKIISNIILIPKVGIMGDQLANIVCYFAIFVINFALLAKNINNIFYFNLIKIVLASGIMCVIAFVFIGNTAISGTWLLISAIILSVIIYFVSVGVLFIENIIAYKKRKNKNIMQKY